MQLLDAVLRRGQALEAALAGATRGIENAADRALAHAIASETLRHIPDLDDLIDGATRQRLPDDAKARMVLRIALVQALVLGTPPHAAIATALPMLEGGPRRLVHGVLGTLFRGKAQLRTIPLLPPKVEERWSKAWGHGMTGAASAALAAPPPLDLTLKNPAETDLWVEKLAGETMAPGHVRVGREFAIIDLPGFAEGAWWVQNISASVPARLLGEGKGRSVLDLCAAPGGKTMQLAAAGWQVTAVEREERRLARLSENLERTHLSADLVTADVLKWEPKSPVDAVLLDAPCSATGIFARHPDVLHRIRARDIAQLAEVQARMVARVADWVKPGGQLIYATCSLEPEEGEAIAEQAQKHGLKLVKPDPAQLPQGVNAQEKGWVRILPGEGRDGFFIAAFTRR
jgi:16S rRNA (cytosine967-C5)-methyltransferase